MNRHMVFIATFGMLVLGTLTFIGCAGTKIRQLAGPEFVKRAKETELAGSFNWTSYIGSTGQRAYLEYGCPALVGSGARTTVYWVPLSELPSNVVMQIKSGTRPWTNWMDRARQSDTGRE